MSLARTLIRTVPAAAAVALAVAARPAAAQQSRVLFSWQGRVDRDASISMRGDRISAPGGFAGLGGTRAASPLPETDGIVRVRVERGRGAVDVVEQPSSRNNYTAVVRIRDDQDGADDYRITAYWQPAYGSVASGRDRGDYDDRDDRDDRRRGRDDRDDRDDRRGGWGRGGWGRGNGGYGGNDDGRGSSGTLRWSGRVDAVEEIRIRGRRADSFAVSGNGASNVRSRVDGALGGGSYLRLNRADGRGQVQIVEQPSRSNGYTAVLRIVDRQAGAGFYDIQASW